MGKSQHYVPQFYLRNFSLQDKKSHPSISIFIKENQKFVKHASIEGQGQDSYYYGKDGLIEDTLARMEGRLAPFIAKIISSGECPKNFSEEYKQLLFFTILVDLRNPVRKNGLESILTHTINHFLKLEEFKDISSLVDIKPKNSSVLGLRHLNQSFILTADVFVKLIVNETDIPFITSDYPVVRYNQFYEQYAETKTTGFGSVGLQLFLPISPKHAIIFYDQQIYYVGGRKGKLVKATRADVEQLNTLQMVNSFSTVFGNQNVDQAYFKELFKRASKFKKPNEIDTLINGDIDKYSENHVVHKTMECRVNLILSFVSLSTYAARFRFAPDEIHQLRKHSVMAKDLLDSGLITL